MRPDANLLLVYLAYDFEFELNAVSGKQLQSSIPAPHIMALVILIAAFLIFLVFMVVFYYGLGVFAIT